jgi:hypothetical protein
MAILKRIQRKITNYLNARKDRALTARHQQNFFTHRQIAPIIRQNRDALSSIPHWIEPQVYEASIFQYGIPAQLRHLLDRPLNLEATYTDAICFLMTQLTSPVNYLELGVSVGKNFFQIANFLKNSSLTGFDIEEINPVLEARFSGKTVDSRWPTTETSMKKVESSLTSYTFATNRVRYLSGDVFDEGSWARLAGEKFNVVFSDAFHSPDALRFEYEMIKRYKLLDGGQFIMMWDDLGGEMTHEFVRIYRDMQVDFGLTQSNLAVNPYRGWMGEYVPKHMIGIIYRLESPRSET